MKRWVVCIDCDGEGKYPSGQVCRSCDGSGQVVEEYWPPYSFAETAAAEARTASRKYWANNDQHHPVHPDVYIHWPIGAPPALPKSGRKWFGPKGED